MPPRHRALVAPVLAIAVGTALLLDSGPSLAADKAKAAAAQAAASQAKSQPPKAQPQPPRPQLVDINSASRTELKTLPNIGDAEADRIIANRPYLTKAHLVAKKVLDLAAYDALRGRIMAVQKAQPKAKR